MTLAVHLLWNRQSTDRAVPLHVAAESLRLMSAPQHRRYRTVLYWRPLVPDLNDTDEYLHRAHELTRHADATVFTGLFYRDQIAEYYKANGLTEPYGRTARRKIMPEALERRVVAAFSLSTRLFPQAQLRRVLRTPPARLQRTRWCPRAVRPVSASLDRAVRQRAPRAVARTPPRGRPHAARGLVIWRSRTSPTVRPSSPV
jgi:hypothetical protein